MWVIMFCIFVATSEAENEQMFENDAVQPYFPIQCPGFQAASGFKGHDLKSKEVVEAPQCP